MSRVTLPGLCGSTGNSTIEFQYENLIARCGDETLALGQVFTLLWAQEPGFQLPLKHFVVVEVW